MKKLLKEFYKKYSSFIIVLLIIIIAGLYAHNTYKTNNERKLIEEVEYYDSLNRYNKIYYSKTFNDLKNENKQLYDSLKKYKDKIDFVLEFSHESSHSTGNVTTKPIIKDSVVHDTVPLIVPQIAKTYEYKNEQADTFQYKLNVNSYTEPLWYSLDVKIKNKFTIVNKSDGESNHITIHPDNGGTIVDVTTFKNKEKRSFFDRISVGPSITAGYDIVSKHWGIMAGGSVTLDLTK